MMMMMMMITKSVLSVSGEKTALAKYGNELISTTSEDTVHHHQRTCLLCFFSTAAVHHNRSPLRKTLCSTQERTGLPGCLALASWAGWSGVLVGRHVQNVEIGQTAYSVNGERVGREVETKSQRRRIG